MILLSRLFMTENKQTECECPIAGYCNRHQVNKSAHLHKLCQNHIGYFNMWEECRGPNQNPNDCTKNSQSNISNFVQENISSEDKKDIKLPSTMQMAKNFISSATKHLQNGMQHVTDEQQKQRLDICAGCEFIVENGSRCGKCGCFLQTKTKWASSNCPIGKW